MMATLTLVFAALIGARSAAFSGGGGLSARSYVQDGLVAMWDGIENAGWGTHDDSIQSWKELVSGNDAAATGTLVWNDSNLHCTGASKVTYQSDAMNALFGSLDNDFTIEVFSKADFVAKTEGYAGSFIVEGVGWGPRAWNYNNKYDTKQALSYRVHSSNYLNALISGAENINTLVMAYDHTSPNSQCYINGQLRINLANNTAVASISTVSIGASSHGNFVGEIYAVRIYNRALSASEIAANYAVDKARFNLP